MNQTFSKVGIEKSLKQVVLVSLLFGVLTGCKGGGEEGASTVDPSTGNPSSAGQLANIDIHGDSAAPVSSLLNDEVQVTLVEDDGVVGETKTDRGQQDAESGDAAEVDVVVQYKCINDRNKIEYSPVDCNQSSS